MNKVLHSDKIYINWINSEKSTILQTDIKFQKKILDSPINIK